MKQITLTTTPCYDVLIEKGLLQQAGQQIKTYFPDLAQVHIVSDSNVAPLYANTLQASLEKVGICHELAVVPAGEESKSIASLTSLLETWTQQEVHRTDMVIALGGGVVGDLVGFAASIYQRGIDFIQIPTTFLAAIDSSVGGKTAVNLQSGKNLVGSFHQPRLVLCDPSSFQTLTDDIFKEGVAEALKYGLLTDESLFQQLTQRNITATSPCLDAVIASCVTHKKHFVEADTFDKGLRQKLNLGHTIAHAIEALSHYQIPHGQAVATGLAMISRAGEKLGKTQKGTSQKVDQALANYGFHLSASYSSKDLAEACRHDKKAHSQGVNFIIPEKIGLAHLVNIPFDDLEMIFALGKEPL